MSRWPWLAARCSGVSSPRFMTLMRAPRMMSMSTTLERPSRQAQCRGLNPWSSLQGGGGSAQLEPPGLGIAGIVLKTPVAGAKGLG